MSGGSQYYPRPLKATLAFQPTPPSLSSRPSPGSPSSSSSSSNGRSASRVPAINSPDYLSGDALCANVDGECSARRSSSLSSLTDASGTMWPRSPQMETQRGTTATHRRSNSLTKADDKTLQSSQVMVAPIRCGSGNMDVQWRHSAEGLNQEVSAVLEGKMLFCDEQHPDGHRAPVSELLGGPKMSVHSSSPFSSSPWQPCEQDSSLIHRDSPHTVEYLTHYSNIPSPNFSFAREPPDSAERCTIIQEPGTLSEEVVPKGPDKSKANIVFKGSAFAPLLPTHSLKSMVIT